MDTDWNDLRERVAAVHEQIESASLINKIDNEVRESALHEIFKIHEELSRISGVTANNAGVEDNAYSS